MLALLPKTSVRERGAPRKHWALGSDGQQGWALVTPPGAPVRARARARVCVCVCVCVQVGWGL